MWRGSRGAPPMWPIGHADYYIPRARADRRPPDRSRPILAKTASISPAVLALRTTICSPRTLTTRSPPTGDLRSTHLKLGQHVAAESHRSPVAHIKSVLSRPQSQFSTPV